MFYNVYHYFDNFLYLFKKIKLLPGTRLFCNITKLQEHLPFFESRKIQGAKIYWDSKSRFDISKPISSSFCYPLISLAELGCSCSKILTLYARVDKKLFGSSH